MYGRKQLWKLNYSLINNEIHQRQKTKERRTESFMVYCVCPYVQVACINKFLCINVLNLNVLESYMCAIILHFNSFWLCIE